ncbi:MULTISPECIES: ketopantoate reductase family protein [Microbacterium]|jgi:2-dehydropantoate 2-reductase|uniref:ketopantoate reductase family protein n=1 Tax=Microbacterium TaxID=33882 RepID=UPI0010FA6095|nr:2-dehydropantoate 2-reductase N-terminal domain-containing protein [Microbacterium sp. 4NA327F11]MCK9916734.1 NAD(P)-binding domain-containing protein [Microbacteriaceae bacterium K1510]
MSSPRIAFVGTGAQGAGIGADLIRAGLDVTFIEQWPAHVEAMRANGITVHLPTETQNTPVDALHLCEVATLRAPFDIVFVLVKAYDTRWAVELIAPHLAPDGLVVGLQNGMSLDDIAEIVGAERTIGAVIEMASNMFEPGVVTRQNAPENSWFAVGGIVPSAQARAHEVQAVLRHAGVVEVSADIRSSKWMKLVANAGELVPSAILDETLYDAVRMPGVHEFMIECGKEAARAAVADGSTLVPIFGLTHDQVTGPDQYAADLLGEVLDKYSLPDTRTTVLHDWMKGRHSEYREVNGLVVDVLERVGEAAPVNAHVVEIARRIEAGELERGRHNLDLLLRVGVHV